MAMSKAEVTNLIAAILSTLNEVNSWAPESTFYILCGMDLDKWNYIRGIMVRADWVSIKSNVVTLTSKGTNMAILIDKAVAANRAIAN